MFMFHNGTLREQFNYKEICPLEQKETTMKYSVDTYYPDENNELKFEYFMRVVGGEGKCSGDRTFNEPKDRANDRFIKSQVRLLRSGEETQIPIAQEIFQLFSKMYNAKMLLETIPSLHDCTNFQCKKDIHDKVSDEN